MADLSTPASESPIPKRRHHLPRLRVGMFRYSVAYYLGALVLMIVIAPILDQWGSSDLLQIVIMSVVLMSGTIAVGHHRRTLVYAIALIVPAITSKWIDHFQDDLVPNWIPVAFMLVYVSFVLVQLFTFILRAPRVNSEVLCAGIATYFTLGVCWAGLYIFVDNTTPGSFNFPGGPPDAQGMRSFTAFYFSFITLSTVGFGDITPASGVARMLTMLEAIVGTFYMAIMVARLVALYTTEKAAAA